MKDSGLGVANSESFSLYFVFHPDGMKPALGQTLDSIVQKLLRRGLAERRIPAPAVLERPDVVEGVGKDQPAFFCADHARAPVVSRRHQFPLRTS
jgi:hypothetical protein